VATRTLGGFIGVCNSSSSHLGFQQFYSSSLMEEKGNHFARLLQECADKRIPWWKREWLDRPLWQWLFLTTVVAGINLIPFIM